MLSRNVKEVWICLESPKFVYSIFPTLMRWRQSGAAIKAYLPPVSTTGHSGYQMRLLKALGIELGELSNPPFKGFLIDPSHQDNALAVVYWEDPPNNKFSRLNMNLEMTAQRKLRYLTLYQIHPGEFSGKSSQFLPFVAETRSR